MGDYNARSIAVRKVNNEGKVEDKPSSVIFVFGGSSSLGDKLKQDTAAPVRAFVPDKSLARELIRRTRYMCVTNNSHFLSEKEVSAATYSGDSKYGIGCANELQKQGIRAEVRHYNRDGSQLKDPLGSFIMSAYNARELAIIGVSALQTNATYSKISVSDISTKVFDEHKGKSQGRGMF